MTEALEPAKTRRPMHTYDEEHIVAGLTELALCGGNAKITTQRLADKGYDIPRSTLDMWKRQTHPDRYVEIQQTLAPQIAEKIAAQAEEFAIDSATVEAEALAILRDKLSSMDAKDVAAALRNITTSKSLNVDKIASPLRGRPTQTIIHVSLEDSWRRLQQEIPALKHIDSTAEDITDTHEPA